jgi:LPXTG-motif cell wall-anchored protein
MGTKILYTIGGIMVVAGGVFLAAKKRMNTIQE